MITFTVPEENGKKVLRMAEYIEREALRDELLSISIDISNLYGCGVLEGLDRATKRLNEQPAADVAPVRHGKWIDLGKDYWERGRTSTRYKCSECGRRSGEKQVKLYHYCPNCGAKMEVKE